MENIATTKWYYYIDMNTGKPTIEIEYINKLTGVTVWKLYQAATKEKVKAIAKAQETKFFNRVNRVYNNRGI